MINIMKFGSYKSIIKFDSELDMFRGEFIDLNGGADFYAKTVDGLKKEGKISLKLFLQACKEKGIEAKKSFSGKFNLRISPQLHEKISQLAASENISLNHLVADELKKLVNE